MATQTVTYKGKVINIQGDGGAVQMTIDGKSIQVQFDDANNRYMATEFLAYTDYASPLALAKAIVDSGTNR